MSTNQSVYEYVFKYVVHGIVFVELHESNNFKQIFFRVSLWFMVKGANHNKEKVTKLNVTIRCFMVKFYHI